MLSSICVLSALHLLVVVRCEHISANDVHGNVTCRHSSKNRNTTFYNHTPFSYLIKEESLCSGDVHILNYVQSSSTHFSRRMIIRETFGSLKYIEGDSVKLVFVVGLSGNARTQTLIRAESENYRDIVQANFKDTYSNLTIKHIVALHWIHHFCAQAKIISKSDDDTFVNNFLLRDFIVPYLSIAEPFLLGQISFGELPIRNRGNKWTVDERMFDESQYPPYMKGFGYIISRTAVEPLLVCAYHERFLYIDDVFITGIVARSANITLKDFQRPFSIGSISNGDIKMDVIDHIFLVGNNEMNPDSWRDVWQNILHLIL